MRKIAIVVAVVVAVVVATICFFNRFNWQKIAQAYGGQGVTVDEAQRPCYWYEHDQQLLCFNVFQGWFGGTDAAPAYVIDHGKFLPIFYDHRRG